MFDAFVRASALIVRNRLDPAEVNLVAENKSALNPKIDAQFK